MQTHTNICIKTHIFVCMHAQLTPAHTHTLSPSVFLSWSCCLPMNIPGIRARENPDPSSSSLLFLSHATHNLDLFTVQPCHAWLGAVCCFGRTASRLWSRFLDRWQIMLFISFLTPFPKNSDWEYKLRSSLCTHAVHHTNWKDPDIHVLDGWKVVTNNKNTQHAPSMKLECVYPYGWIKNGHIHKISPKMVNPRYIAGNTEEEEMHWTINILSPFLLQFGSLPYVPILTKQQLHGMSRSSITIICLMTVKL